VVASAIGRANFALVGLAVGLLWRQTKRRRNKIRKVKTREGNTTLRKFLFAKMVSFVPSGIMK
jgi:hypothetical protein